MEPAALIRAMGHRLTTVHLSDYAPEGPRHVSPGTGDPNWPRLLHALETVDYRGPLILELAHVQDPEVLLDAYEFMRGGWEHVAARAD